MTLLGALSSAVVPNLEVGSHPSTSQLDATTTIWDGTGGKSPDTYGDDVETCKGFEGRMLGQFGVLLGILPGGRRRLSVQYALL